LAEEITQICPTFVSALSACGAGYNDSDVADVIAFKTAHSVSANSQQFAPEQAINSILAIGIAAADISDRPLTVLDFGGGCGFHYFWVSPMVKAPLRWVIVETPTMAERAAKLAQGHFELFTEVASAAELLGRVDIVHASTAIQYVPDPLATLKTLAALRARYILLARFPLWRDSQLVGVQTSTLAGNGIGPMPPTIANRQIRYPITFTNFNHVLQTLGDYEAALAIESPNAIYAVRGQQVQCATIIFRLK
jgi:putative methyltransferase (TIGR04325 family)